MTRYEHRLATDGPRVLGRSLSTDEMELLCSYLAILRRWNSVHRIVGSVEDDWVARHVVLDSLLFLRVLPPAAIDVLDVGSGAGVPGLILKIVRRNMRLVMVEATRRRASFLSEAVRVLGLSETRVINARAEDLSDELKGQFDAVVARCADAPESIFTIGVGALKAPGLVVVAGPPKEGLLSIGQWVEVDGIEPGETRRFGVLVK